MPHTAERRRANAADMNAFMIEVRTARSRYLADLVRGVVAAITPSGRRGR